MARQEFTIGAPSTSTSSTGEATWEDINLSINSELRDDPSSENFLVSLTLFPGDLCEFQTTEDPEDEFEDPDFLGPDLSTAWENSPRAITIEAGDVTITIAGPGASDPNEPYNWVSNELTLTQMQTYLALTPAEKDATVLILDEGLNLHVGDDTVTRVYIGSTEVDTVYVGNSRVFK